MLHCYCKRLGLDQLSSSEIRKGDPRKWSPELRIGLAERGTVAGGIVGKRQKPAQMTGHQNTKECRYKPRTAESKGVGRMDGVSVFVVLMSTTKPTLLSITKALHLVEQWGDGIVAAVQNEKQRRNLCPPEFKEFILFTYHLLRMKEKSGLVKQLAAVETTGTGSEYNTQSTFPNYMGLP